MQKSIFMILCFFFIANAEDGILYPTTGKQFEPIVVRIEKNFGFENPFDLVTNQVELFIVQPDFTRKILSFFYNGTDAQNTEQWLARFTPKQAGLYTFTVRVNGIVLKTFSVSVEQNKAPKQGGLQRTSQLGTFRYESGESFRGVGLNVCWAEDYEYYFKKMKAVGINVVRIWMCPWHLPLEWSHTGLGRYDLSVARRLDSIVTLAEQYNIFIILCFDYHGIAPKGPGYFRSDRWSENPYNALLGGPCVEKVDLFTNPIAIKFQKQRYKYIISRYGYSRAIGTWEFFNEADLMAGNAIAINRWHEEMAEYVQSIDIHDRLVTSSSTRRHIEKIVDAFQSSAFDYVHFHDYNMTDVAPHFTYLLEGALEYYRKPVVIAEYGIEFRSGEMTYKHDSAHVGFHNGLWAGLFNETPILPMSWWWDSYIDRYNLWYQFEYLVRFMKEIDFNQKYLLFKTLPPPTLRNDSSQQVLCFTRALYFGEHCALWMRNDDYKWWLVNEGTVAKELGAFAQLVPDLLPGKYAVQWYDPQRGVFDTTKQEASVGSDGVLSLVVPSFAKDRACLIRRISAK